MISSIVAGPCRLRGQDRLSLPLSRSFSSFGGVFLSLFSRPFEKEIKN